MVDNEERQGMRPGVKPGEDETQRSMKERLLREQQLSGERQKEGRGWSELPTEKDLQKKEGVEAHVEPEEHAGPTPSAHQAELAGTKARRHPEEQR